MNEPADIVRKLRARKIMLRNGSGYYIGDAPDTDCQEAADLIERLSSAPKDGRASPREAPKSELQAAEMLIGELRDVSNARFDELQRAQRIIDGLKDYRESLLTCRADLEPGGRARIRECCTPHKDAYDEAVQLLLADYERLLSCVVRAPDTRGEANPSPPADGGEQRHVCAGAIRALAARKEQ